MEHRRRSAEERTSVRISPPRPCPWSYTCAHKPFGGGRGTVVSRFDDADAPSWYVASVLDDILVVSYQGLAVFTFDSSSSLITGFPEKRVSVLTMSHLLLDQVMPLLLAWTGREVLHASAVALDTNKGPQALVLLGDSGAGKSSTAYAASEVGADLLADDFVVVGSAEGRPALLGIDQRGVRLWDDCVADLRPNAGSERVSQHNSKRRVNVTSGPTPESLPLLAIIALETRGPAGAAPALSPMLPLATTMQLLHHSFRVDPTDRLALEQTLDAAAVLASRVPGFEVQMPADLGGLRSACRVLLDKVLAATSEPSVR